MKKNQFFWAIPAAAALLVLSCKKDDSKKELASGIIKENMDTLVKPGDDFDAYVNGAWLKKNEIPADKSSYGVDGILDDEAQANVRKIIEDAAKKNASEGSNDQKIGDFYNSYIDQKTRDAKGLEPIQPELQKVLAIKTYEDLYAYFGYANAHGTMSPFSLSVMEDLKDPNTHMVMTWQGGLGLPEREYYLLQDTHSKEIRSKYEAHIASVLSLAAIPDASAKAKS
ncbi:MAG: peptidase M13, partial [Chitinophagaceae bacterium]